MIFHVDKPHRVLGALAARVDFVLLLPRRIRRAVRGYATAGRFRLYGNNFNFDPDGTYSYERITVGSNVNLGAGATLVATRSEIRIGNHVMFGPNVTIRGGNHRFDIVGRFIDTVGDDEKRPQDDPGVIIEDDVWIGTNATILGGVTVGRGSVVGAGAVVTKDVPRYSIVGGNPARVIRSRFSPDEIESHEAAVYPEGLRPLPLLSN